MEITLLGARLILALIFLVAGLAKLTDRSGSRQALQDFGIPTSLAGPLSIALPLAELTVAVALVPLLSAWWAALGALTLLLLFSAAIAVNLARGRTPDCHCFGQLHSSPAGWPTLLRNGVLAGVAGFIVWQGWSQVNVGLSALGWLGHLTTVEQVGLLGGLLGLGLLGGEGWLLLHLLQQNGRLLVRIEAAESRLAVGTPVPPPAVAPAQPVRGLSLGAPAPSFRLTGLRGEILTLEALRAMEKPVLLLFSDPNCGPCNALLPEIGRWQREYPAQMVLAVISRGTEEANRAKSTEHGLTHVLLQVDREVAQAYQAAGTPSAVLVRPDGTIGSPVAAGAEAIRTLVTRTVGGPAPVPLLGTGEQGPCPNCGKAHGVAPSPSPASRPIGEPVPEVRLPDLSGTTRSLAEFRGMKILLLFWNPNCGFCRHMLDELKAWETNPPPGAPKLLVVSTGTVEANQALGLQSVVVLDQGFSVGRAFGASGTPSAILVDADGKIASELAVGAPAVLALAQDRDPAVTS